MNDLSMSIVPTQSSCAIQPIGCPMLAGEWSECARDSSLTCSSLALASGKDCLPISAASAGFFIASAQPLTLARTKRRTRSGFFPDGVFMRHEPEAKRFDAELRDWHAVHGLPGGLLPHLDAFGAHQPGDPIDAVLEETRHLGGAVDADELDPALRDPRGLEHGAEQPFGRRAFGAADIF